MTLTDEQIAQFHDEGWLFLPELFTPVMSVADDALARLARGGTGGGSRVGGP